MVAAQAAGTARIPPFAIAPMLQVAVSVVFTVVVMMPSGGSAGRLRAGLSPIGRTGPPPIDIHRKKVQKMSSRRR